MDRADESMLNEEEGGIPPDADKREQAIAKRSAARTVRTQTRGEVLEGGGTEEPLGGVTHLLLAFVI